MRKTHSQLKKAAVGSKFKQLLLMAESLASGATSINLSGNKLVLGKNGKWLLESSDLDQATLEIETLVTEKEQLAKSLSIALQQAEDLRNEVKEINHVKSVLLEMVSFSFIICLTLDPNWMCISAHEGATTADRLGKYCRGLQG